MHVATTLTVFVHYPAAEKPFKTEADASETVGQLKARALGAFGLIEGQLPDGNIATYTLFYEKRALDNPNETLGQVAGKCEDDLKLKLAQQITQG